MTVCHVSNRPFVVPDYNLAEPPEDPMTCEDCCFFDEAPRGGDGICTYWHDTQDSARYTWVTAGGNASECNRFQSI